MIWLYRILILPFLLLMSPYYVGRMLKRGGYGKDFSHRFGNVPALPAPANGVKRIWIQAVSVGETEAVAPLLKKLKERKDVEVILTTTTSTAYKIIRDKYADLVTAYACFPIDFWPFSRKAWKRFAPTLVVQMEGELWPEHLHQARSRGIPVLLVNARLSDKSFRRYQKAGAVARRIFSQIDFICAGTQNDFQRFLQLGVPENKIALTGNMKFDAAGGETLGESEKYALYREIFAPSVSAGKAGDVLLGSSTWPGEEAVMIDTFRRARQSNPALKLLIVPRHAERRSEITALLENSEFRWYLRSKTKTEDVPADTDICIADTTGELRRLSQIATVAFVGKSLLPNKGGQTPIECAAIGVPLVYGTEMTNFKDVCRALEDIGSAIKVRDGNAAAETLCALLNDPAKRERMSAAEKAWHADNQGATARVLSRIERYIG
ncbi:MAG: 3-deoxy-D-manno-octulosonic acid transferase [Opitutales bacterium]|nr:3-deoxy-D-manno-octulosonic acid transferase [Opitutales bacterium]